MADFVIGDIHGCFEALRTVLKKVSFNARRDRLITTGDLVNRGPDSLQTLRFCYQLGSHFLTVLGNHDLHLLAVARGARLPSISDKFDAILQAPDRDKLLNWLQRQPLLINIKQYTVVHAGIPPQWSLVQAERHANEISMLLQSNQADVFFNSMYGNNPTSWDENFTGMKRYRAITNYLTRMRRCKEDGSLEFSENDASTPYLNHTSGFAAWFTHRQNLRGNENIIFGHWAALKGNHGTLNLLPMDAAYVWGGKLRVVNLDNGDIYEHPAGTKSYKNDRREHHER